MQPVLGDPKSVRFGVFEADLVAGELRKRGRRVTLQDQPFQVLALLLQRAGDVITREELQKALWPADTFVEFDQGVNTAVKKIRRALGDSAENPRFVETLPRKGYRFIAPVAAVEPPVAAPAPQRRSPWILAGLGSAAVVAAVAAVWFLAGKSPREAPVTPVPLTSYPGQELQPSFSPDGNYVAFAWNGERQDNFDIYVKQIGTEKPLRLTTDPAKDFGPACGPPKRFIASTYTDMFPQFSPDGRRILYLSDRSGRTEVWVSNEDGSNPMQVTSMNAPIVGAPRWSPDGERIVFDSNLGGRWEVYVISAAGGPPRRLTDHPADDCCGNWSRDGRWIYFMSRRTGESQIWKMPAGGGEAVQITKHGGHVAIESPDGRFVYYSVSGGEGERNGLTGLRRVPVDGGEEMDVLPSVTFYNFAVAPEGIYFISRADAEGRYAIHFFSFATGKTRPILTVSGTVVPGLSVSPDGRSILYSQIDERRSDLMLVENFR